MYILSDYTITWSDNGPIVSFKSPFILEGTPIPGPKMLLDYGTTRRQIIDLFKNFHYNIEVTISHELIQSDLAPKEPNEQYLIDPETGELFVDEFGLNVYTFARFCIEKDTLKDLRYD